MVCIDCKNDQKIARKSRELNENIYLAMRDKEEKIEKMESNFES